MPKACHYHAMANLQVKKIPDSLHPRLRMHARKRHCTLSELVLKALERELAHQQFQERLALRAHAQLGVSAAELLEEERQNRDRAM